MRLTALDLSSKFGWACPGQIPGEPMSGSVKLLRREEIVGCDPEPLWSKLWDWLDDHRKVHQPDGIIYEAPILKGGEPYDVTDFLFGLAHTAALWAYRNQLRVWKGHVNTVRATVVGDGRCGKDGVILWCAKQGWNPVDDNAADALALWEYWDAEMNRRPRRPRLEGFLL